MKEHLVFKRYDSFLDRLNTVREFFNTAQQFLKLEKVEIGGIRGKALTNNINKVHEEFKDLYGVFANRTYDSLDPKDKGFLKDYEKFNSKIFALDRKLGAILSRAFDDCIVTESIFKLLHIFGTLTQRNLIALELSDKMPLLVCMLNTEMDEAKNIFLKQQKRIKESGKALTDRNMPPVSGQLKFAQELRDKISASIRNFKELSHPICYSEGANLVFRKFKEMIALLSAYEEESFKGWTLSAEKKTAEGLNRPLIIRDESNGTLKVNFGRDTLSILMEVKHMRKDFPARKLPEKALEIVNFAIKKI